MTKCKVMVCAVVPDNQKKVIFVPVQFIERLGPKRVRVTWPGHECEGTLALTSNPVNN